MDDVQRRAEREAVRRVRLEARRARKLGAATAPEVLAARARRLKRHEETKACREKLKSERPFHFKLAPIKRRAEAKGLPYDLTPEWAEDMWKKLQGRCFYSGLEMRLIATHRHPLMCTFDRMVPELGYVQSNVILCTFCMNMLKSDMTIEQFVHVLKNTARYIFQVQAIVTVPGWDQA